MNKIKIQMPPYGHVPAGTSQLVDVTNRKKLKLGEVGITSLDLQQAVDNLFSGSFCFFPLILHPKKGKWCWLSCCGSWNRLLTLGTPAPEGYGTWSVCVCLSVCPAPRVLPLRATERPTEGTHGFSASW